MISRPDFKFKRLVRAFGSIPFALPPILMALGFVLFWGNSGLINRLLASVFGEDSTIRILYRPSAMIFCHAVYNFPLVLRLVGDAFTKLRRRYSAAAFSLGASPIKTAWTVIFPLAAREIAASILLIFLYCWTSFTIALLIGGINGGTLAVEIYRAARTTLNFRAAGILSLIETGLAALVFALFILVKRKNRTFFSSGLGHDFDFYQTDKIKDKNAAIFSKIRVLYFIFLAFMALGPIFTLCYRSFISAQSRAGAHILSLANYMASSSMWAAFLRSLTLSVLAASFAIVLAFFAAEAAMLYKKERSSFKKDAAPKIQTGSDGFLRALMLSPITSSGIVLGFGFLLLFGREQSRSILLAAFAQAILALPFAYSSLYSALSGIPERVRSAALISGASPLKRFWTVDLPLSAQALRSAFGFSACISLGELNTIMMLGLENWETLPLFIYRAAGAYRHGAASAAGVLLILLCFFALALSDLKAFHKNSKAD